MSPIFKSSCCLLGACLILWAFNTSFSSAQQTSSVRSKTNLEAGKTTYNTSCAGCHGLDGRGSDKAANISGTTKVQHLSDTQLSSIISNGVPDRMPGFRNLSEKQTRAVVSYLRSLQGKLEGRETCPVTQDGGSKYFSAKANAQVVTRFPVKAGSLDLIFPPTERAHRRMQFETRSCGHAECRHRAIDPPCLLHPRVIALRV